MEWDSKTCGWNSVSKLEIQDNTYNHSHNHHNHHNHHHLDSLASSNGSGFTNMFSVDLKLGRLEEIGDLSMEESLKQSMPFNMVSSSSSSSSSPALALSRRGRPRNSGSAQNNVFCSVDGCTSDLHQGREYHRRHKVCERHSKTPVVLVGGKEQRFCQQCSRFHSLEEFDEVKRSCRKRLDGHNRRRRKRQPEALYMPDSTGGFLSSHTGDGMLQFCCPQINTGNWATMSQSDTFFRNNQETIYQPLMNGIASTGSKRGGLKVSPDSGSGCALSLLSSYPSQSSGICVGSSMQSTMVSLSAQDSSTDLNLSNNLVQVSLSQGLEYIDNSASLSNTTTSANVQSFGGFHSTTHDVFRENGSSSRIFPFGWE